MRQIAAFLHGLRLINQAPVIFAPIVSVQNGLFFLSFFRLPEHPSDKTKTLTVYWYLTLDNKDEI